MKKCSQYLALLLVLFSVSCAYRIDIRQGNYFESKSVQKLRVNMSKEQVAYVMGNPILKDAFNDDTWHYLYTVDYGKRDREDSRLELYLTFVDNKLQDMTGNIDKPEDFDKPLDE